ncbi:flavin-dependent oxidoreductase [Tropicimonas sp. S265A]|uniref:flavin-dependent oxidoreductase n=1 Tax=Tropicimonas sp. S265A TaxID=3415134 RepID=UPI003C7AE97A
MTVMIAGAGIGGLSLALSLHQAGIDCTVYEAVREVRPLGVGINLQPHAARELFELGLENALDEIGLRTAGLAYFTAQGNLVWEEPRGMQAGYNWPQYSIHRGALQMALYWAFLERGGSVLAGYALKSWEEDSHGITATFMDRRTGHTVGRERGSVLIGADGINSAMRARLFPNEGPARWGGTMMWRGTTEAPRLRDGRTVCMIGSKARKFVVYPIADRPDGRSLLNWIADIHDPARAGFAPQDWNREGRLQDFLPAFEDMVFDWLDVPQVIRKADTIYEYPMVDRDPLPRWSHGRVTLLGDAAHPMYPIGSNGASQAILDGRYLARALIEGSDVKSALARYEADRRETVNALVLANRGDGPDKILDVVAERAPDGFERIEDVITREELASQATSYKALAGMDVATLNTRPPILGQRADT